MNGARKASTKAANKFRLFSVSCGLTALTLVHRHIPSFCVVGLSIACRCCVWAARAPLRTGRDGTRGTRGTRGRASDQIFGCVDREIVSLSLRATPPKFSEYKCQHIELSHQLALYLLFSCFFSVSFFRSPRLLYRWDAAVCVYVCFVCLGERRRYIFPSLFLLLLC